MGSRRLAALAFLVLFAVPAAAVVAESDLDRLGERHPRSVRADAWMRLLADGEAAVLHLLRAAATHPDRSVRVEAVRLTGLVGSPRATGTLLALLSADDPRLAQVAAHALGEIGDPEATAPLVALATAGNGPPAVRRSSVVALGLLGDPRAAPALERLLHGPDATLAVLAAGSLGLLARDVGYPVAMAAVASEAPARRLHAVQALGLIGKADAREALAAVLASRSGKPLADACRLSLLQLELRQVETVSGRLELVRGRLEEGAVDPGAARWCLRHLLGADGGAERFLPALTAAPAARRKLRWDSEGVHPWLTRLGVELAGIPETADRCWSCAAAGAPAPECAWIDEGSVKEDYFGTAGGSWDTDVWGSDGCGQDPTGTWMHHAYNPYTEAGWWGLSDLNALDYGVPIWDQAVADYRGGDLDAAFFGLGRVSHLVEDMTAPAHANADVHATGDDAEEWGKLNHPSLDPAASEPERPSTQTEYPDLVEDSCASVLKNVAWRTYHATTYQAVLVTELGPGAQPDSELERMFPGLEYLDDWYYPDYWFIPEVGDFLNGIDPFGDSEWWRSEGADDDGTGYYYLENIINDDDWACAAGGCVTPAVRRVVPSSRVLYVGQEGQSAYLDTVLEGNTIPLVELDAEILYPVAVEWLAGLYAFFGETAPGTQNLPWAPRDLVAAAGSPTSIDLDWTDASGNEMTFLVERRSSGGVWLEVGSVAADVTSYRSSALLPGATYSFRVRGANVVGVSPPSNEASATTTLDGVLFADGFDAGGTGAWSAAEP